MPKSDPRHDDATTSIVGTTAVLGLGNPLLADDALGLVALERLVQQYELDASVSLHDGGTWGLQLMPMIEELERALSRWDETATWISLQRLVPEYRPESASPPLPAAFDALAR